MKVLIVLGTRPEAIKFAPVIRALKETAIETIVCVSGQHKEMLQPMLDLFGIIPDNTLNTMTPGQSLNILASKIFSEIDAVIEQHNPDWILVQGDTTTAMTAGLAAFHKKIKVGHIEAGLRTGDLNNPFPEEANRSILSRIAKLHFAPTVYARDALLREGVQKDNIIVTGNTVVDAVNLALSIAKNKLNSNILIKYLGDTLPQPMILITCHRRENFGSVLENICYMIRRLCTRYPNYHWVFPVHLNPNVKEPVYRLLSNIENLSLLPPVDYLTSLQLIASSCLVVTDSGGIQEEAPSFGIPVVVMRSFTERMEGMYAGVASLAGQEPAAIEAEIDKWLSLVELPEALIQKVSPYGDGKASDRIIKGLLDQTTDEFIFSVPAR